ncbi:MAG TPA: hypothetical protein VF161_03925 [Steroidobacteraceae bacterium]|jgi:hypothetical protein
MLSLRLVIFAGLSAIALWGLYSLLDTLGEPQLLQSRQISVLKGCDTLESGEASRRCPSLLCQKHLLDQRLAPLTSKFTVTVDRVSEKQRLIGGSFRRDSTSAEQAFACVLEGPNVTAASVLDSFALDALASQDGGWVL